MHWHRQLQLFGAQESALVEPAARVLLRGAMEKRGNQEAETAFLQQESTMIHIQSHNCKTSLKLKGQHGRRLLVWRLPSCLSSKCH